MTIIRIFLILYGIIAISTGFLGIVVKYDPLIPIFEDNSHRFISSIWASTSLAFFYVAWKPEHTVLFRFLIIALFLGGIVRLAALINYFPDTPTLVTIFLELVPTPILWWMHTRYVLGKD
ncbi:MAG: DUF4345 family protein [Bacteroidota bacterium]